MNTQTPDYVLTLVQHTYCKDCALIKNKIAEVYITSGLRRGEESKNWRIQIVSPPWDRDLRRAAFPSGFDDVDVPALKMEVNNRVVAATQEPAAISVILTRLKEMLIDRRTNEEMASEILRLSKSANGGSSEGMCSI
ncbi:MAG TPA: hypothetical protein VJH03_10530 [Blastocatellia bacterium]|nr:hypothetical protein [Blastocatellia bacterium]